MTYSVCPSGPDVGPQSFLLITSWFHPETDSGVVELENCPGQLHDCTERLCDLGSRSQSDCACRSIQTGNVPSQTISHWVWNFSLHAAFFHGFITALLLWVLFINERKNQPWQRDGALKHKSILGYLLVPALTNGGRW